MGRLPFLDPDLEHVAIRDFWLLREHDIPAAGGVYILLTAPGITFRYPRYSSPVFYIGQAQNLKRRLCDHLRWSADARDNRKEALYYPVYEYAAAHGGRYTYILTKTRRTPKKLEDIVLACFAERYRSWPVANGRGAWTSLFTMDELEARK